MARIKQVLNERRLAYEDACNIRREPTENIQVAAPSVQDAKTPVLSESSTAGHELETDQVSIDKLRYERKGRRLRIVKPHAIGIARANAFRSTPPESSSSEEAGSTVTH